MREMPRSFLGAGRAPATGLVDFRLARQSLLNQFRKGRLSRLDICDAQSELLRAATNVGEATSEVCPVCEDTNLVLVSYVFGPTLPPSGQCVTSKAELRRLAHRGKELACYVVEVCTECRWNHLIRQFPVTARR